jgi:hypothetical protein
MVEHNVTYAVASKLAKPSYKREKLRKSLLVPEPVVLPERMEEPIPIKPRAPIDKEMVEAVAPIDKEMVEAVAPIDKEIVEAVAPIDIDIIAVKLPEERVKEGFTNLAPYICFINIFWIYLWVG